MLTSCIWLAVMRVGSRAVSPQKSTWIFRFYSNFLSHHHRCWFFFTSPSVYSVLSTPCINVCTRWKRIKIVQVWSSFTYTASGRWLGVSYIALCRPVCTIRGIIPYKIMFMISWEYALLWHQPSETRFYNEIYCKFDRIL